MTKYQDMRLLGQIEHGEYRDDCEDLDPSVIERYYGVDDEDQADSDSNEHDSNDSDSGSDDGVENLEGERV